jgi:hypothetical protein
LTFKCDLDLGGRVQVLYLTYRLIIVTICAKKYDKQDQQGKAAFNERNPHTTQQQEPVARSPGGPQTKTRQGTIQVISKSLEL